MEEDKEISIKEERIRKITKLYYSRPDVQKALFEFSKNREISPRFFEGFGKRPDSFQYPGDIFEYVKKGATSFHCSEELWKDPLDIKTGMTPEEANNLRIGWDLLIDIDSKYIDYSKVSAQIILEVLKFHGIKNVGIKFSGSKGFHLIVPWKAIPKEVNGVEAKNMFPEWARILSLYITEKTKPQLIKRITELMNPNSKYIRDFQAPKEVMPDIILVSPRHLFRMPYSLHEKTALASIVLKPEEIEKFQLKDAKPMTMKIRNYMPDCREGEAKELLMQAMDWWKEHNQKKESEKTYSEKKEFKPIQITNISKDNFPPCIKKILEGNMGDGKKRSVFILINFLRSAGLDKVEVEKIIYEWNKKNNPSLKEGYIGTQISWAYNKKPILPPNCKEFYKGVGVCLPDTFCAKAKNPVNYFVRKSLQTENKPKTKKVVKKIS
ncbi:DNA primase large subunit PriL [uncultured archaeon]|nr:DNA primase large subunit PriL [uncultured archaeon]